MKKILLFAMALLPFLFTSAQPCSDLFFSEYVEGSSNNKALEIYNPTPNTINLSNYRVLIIGYTNAGNALNGSFNLSGTIAPGEVVVLANSQATLASINDNATFTVSGTGNVTSFTGDDALVLLNGNDTLDIIGELGPDPGDSWTVGTGSTQNHTLVRKASVNEGTKNWSLRDTQWDIFPQDTTRLGSHTMTPCPAPADTIASFSPVSATIAEAVGTYDLTVVLNQSADIAKTVDVVLTSGNAADVDNFSSETLTFASGETTKTITLDIVDNTVLDGNRTLTFTLQNASSGLLLGNQTFTLTITDDEVAPNPVYPISVLRTVDANGVPDSIGVICEVRGTVLGINNRATGIQFTIYDGTGGIGVFSPSNTFGYTVNEGDSVSVVGEVGQFNGLTQMTFLDTVYKVGTGNLPAPKLVAFPNESVESQLIRVNNVTITNPANWNNANAAGFTVKATSAGNEFEIRIDEQTALFNEPVPQGSFDIIGIGGQFDASSPFTSFYSVAPRYISDIIFSVGIAEKNKGVANLKLYPNPAADKVFVSFNAEINATASLSIFDLAGKQVLANTIEIAKGENKIKTATTTLKNGLYLLKIAAEGFEINQQLLISK